MHTALIYVEPVTQEASLMTAWYHGYVCCRQKLAQEHVEEHQGPLNYGPRRWQETARGGQITRCSKYDLLPGFGSPARPTGATL